MKNLFLFPFLLLSLVTSAQKAPVVFKSKTVNFGKVKESAGKVFYRFIFTNKGENPLKIDKVTASCGCTAAEYTPEAIVKDSSGFIRVSYSTSNRPGEFNKNIIVYFKGHEEPETLTVKGIVIGNNRMLEREFVYSLGNMKFQAGTLNFGTVRTGVPARKAYEFYNAGSKDLQLKQLKYDTSFMKVSVRKTVLKPNELSEIIVTYNGTKRKDWGFVTDTIKILTSDDIEPVKSIPVIAHIEEFFPLKAIMAPENGPLIKFEKTEQHLGTVREGATPGFTFKFTNAGKSDLIIRKIVPGCKCLTFETEKYIYKPGEAGTIKVTMDTKYREGVQNKNTTIITNSPSNPSLNLWIRVNVLSN